ncbi:MAG: tRNA uridine-5-carboxymethylaminomethyl(34) synthesis GTPase MnmE [Gammaproteobacteria bacterium]
MQTTDTIAAQATPAGRGGVGIVRISGPACQGLAQQLLGKLPPPRYAQYGAFYDDVGKVLDEGIALYFPAPHSFTGEDVLELQGHGGPVVLDLILQHIYSLGVRPARPGEFSERAFLNDKLDLAQAEAIADLIDAGSQQAARSALRSLQGEFSLLVDNLSEAIMGLRMYVEAAIDFPEEEIDFLADRHIERKLAEVDGELAAIRQAARQGVLLKEGMQVVLAGRPNAGKSSLLNALAGRESAIVTDIPGTTRDLVREEIHIDGMPLHIIDTAGLRDSEDRVEQEGIKRTRQMMTQADRILLLLDPHDDAASIAGLLAELPPDLPVTLIHNKIDLTGQPARLLDTATGTEVYLSAKQGTGLELLRDHLKNCSGFSGSNEGLFMARRRHLEALEKATHYMASARSQLVDYRAGELLAEELRQAQQALGEITGAVSSDALLGRIFSSFCIGK